MNNILIVMLAVGAILGITAFIMTLTRSNRYCLNESYHRGSHTTDRMKLNIIIPIRDRESDLLNITDVLEKIFQHQNIDARYTIIEQAWGKSFNRALLFNAGFLEASASNFSSNYLFQDVDLWPLGPNVIDYRAISDNVIKHPYGSTTSLGGFVLMKNSTFKKMNGWSNEYWGWGAEDGDFQTRAKLLSITIDRRNFIKRYSAQKVMHDDISFSIKKDRPQADRAHALQAAKGKKYKANLDNIKLDGLSNIVYTIESKIKYKNKPNMNRILISI